MKVKGKVIELTKVESLQTAKGELKKKAVVVEFKDGDYTKKIAIEFVNEKIEKIQNARVGDFIEIDYNVNSRKGNNGIWYTSATGWRVNIESNTSSTNDNTDDLPY